MTALIENTIIMRSAWPAPSRFPKPAMMPSLQSAYLESSTATPIEATSAPMTISSCGAKHMEGSAFQYATAVLLENCKIDQFQQYASMLFFRYLVARPADPRAALCLALAAREQVAASSNAVSAVSRATAAYVERARRRLLDAPTLALERCSFAAATADLGPGGADGFLEDLALARAKLATQRLGYATQVAARATQGCVHCHLLNSRVVRSDHKGIKTHAPTLRETLRRDDHPESVDPQDSSTSSGEPSRE